MKPCSEGVIPRAGPASAEGASRRRSFRRRAAGLRVSHWRCAAVSDTPDCLTLESAIFLFFAGVLGGALNAVAGGGSFIAFPALLFTGVPPIPANATNTIALWTAAAASGGAYRKQLDVPRRVMIPLLAASLGRRAGRRVFASEDAGPHVHASAAVADAGSDSAFCLRKETCRRAQFGDRARSFDRGACGNNAVSIMRRRLRRLLRRWHGHCDARHAGRAGHDRHSRHECAEERAGIRDQRRRGA